MSASGRKLSPEKPVIWANSESHGVLLNLKRSKTGAAKRKHNKELFSSTVFDEHAPEYEPRCTFSVDAPTHRERRHFKKQYNGQLKI